MRWMVTEFVAKLATKNATTSTQKTAIRADARSVRPGTRPSARSAPGVPDPRRGAGRSMSAWSGMVSTARMTARASSAPRQPSRVTSQASSGMKMVLAERAGQRDGEERLVPPARREPADDRGEGGLVERRGEREAHQGPDRVELGKALDPRPDEEERRRQTRAQRHERAGAVAVDPAPDRQRGERRHAHAHREGPGDLAGRPAEVGLHRAEQDGEAVVEDAPPDDPRDTEGRDDDPAVGEAPRIGHRRATLCAPRRSVNCSVGECSVGEDRGVLALRAFPGSPEWDNVSAMILPRRWTVARGFGLIEVVLVLVVVAFAGFLLVRYLGSTARTVEKIQEERPIANARLLADQSTLATVRDTVRTYQAQNGQWPPDKAAVLALFQSPPRFQCGGNDVESDPTSGTVRVPITDSARC